MPSTTNGKPLQIDVDGTTVRLTSPEKQVFPGVTKREVLDYYLAVGGPMLEQVAGRPTALERWPDGVTVESEHFFQKHLPKSAPEYVHGLEVACPSGRPGTLLGPSTRAAIAWAVQMGTITFHAGPVTAPDVAHPDQLRIDLDPSPVNSFDDVRRVAHACRQVAGEWGMDSFVKTTGSRGLHVFIPILPQWTFIDVRHAAIALGRELERRDPDHVTMSWWKEERGDRVFVDFNQNAQDRMMAAAYSLRAHPTAPVSLPIEWGDVDAIDPRDVTLRTVPTLVAERSVDPWSGIRAAAADLAPAMEAWDRDVAAGLPELPYPPEFPKMPGEPPRVQPSRRRG
ncbi:MAG: ATP-dependent DNA ligase [Actinobacteria bacterium]|nr:ATP-dependent DNA ligase [Actinomycetota bacterium]